MRLVHCRVCGGEINRETQTEGTDWCCRSKNYYYHCSCYDTWINKRNNIHAEEDENFWKDAVYDYLKRDLKILVDYQKFNSQWNSFIKKNRTPKGIYFSIRYFYDIIKGDREKAQGGIGIVDFIYEDACEYWCAQENAYSGIVEKIEEQMRAEANREVKVIRRTQKKKKKTPTFEDIESIGGNQ